ncbi:MAG: hypothetical protein KJ726_07040, partial [Verrucomicrobia bacterium]|nr:hypothetical protein [Verrucomicrobiota bacterium]
KSGETMIVREASLDEVDTLLQAVAPLVKVERDFYDIVGARVYAELLGWKRYRVRNPYCMVGVIDGILAGIVNGRLIDEKVGVSYHTLTLKRGARVGSNLFASKMEYHFDILKQEEVLIVAESPIGFRRWMEEYNLAQKFEVQHELGGAPSWVLTKELYLKAKPRLVMGIRPVPEALMASTYPLKQPDLAALLAPSPKK